MKKLKNGVILFLSALLIVGAITGCGSTGAANSATSQKTENSAPASQTPSEQGQKTVLKVAYRQSDNPMTFQDENGNPSGALGEIFAIAAEYLDGYEIEYSRKEDFSDSEKATVTDADKTSKKLKELKKGKTYYVRVRAYKKVGDKKYYSKRSCTSSVFS